MTHELSILRKNLADLEDLVDRVELELVDDPRWDKPSDVSYLSARDRADPDIMANVEAMAQMNALIDWFGQDEEGYVGLWRGPSSTPLDEAPVVRLDTEGQYELVAVGIGNYLAVGSRREQFDADRERLVEVGFCVAASREEIYAALDRLEKPSRHRQALYNAARARRGLPPLT